MKQLPAIGDRVKYTGDYPLMFASIGEVVEHYLGGERVYDDDAGEYYITADHVAIKVDKRPIHWPYPDTDRYAPDIADIEPVD